MKKFFVAFFVVYIACISHFTIADPFDSDDSFDRFTQDFSDQPMHYKGPGISLEDLVTRTDDFFERPIVVVICTYNNSEWAEKNLDSIFSQKYGNVRVIIIDDCSTDTNAQVIQNYINRNNLANRITFIHNKKRMRKLFNLYKALYTCKDDEIVIMLDGDDWLADTTDVNVLQFINHLYNNPNIWFTYGQYRNVPAEEAIKWGFKEIGYCREVPEKIKKDRNYRKYSFVFMHPRSFRAWLFKCVKLEDLIAETVPGFEGDFYPAANDVAMYYPMIEMAHMHVRFISEILYIRNLYNDIVGFKVDKSLQVASAREIRKKQLYPLLAKSKTRDAELEQFLSAQADLFMLTRGKLNNIKNKLDATQRTMINLHTIYVFYEGTEENKNICRKISRHYINVIFVPYYNPGSLSLKNRLLECIAHTTQNHIILTNDSCEVIIPINLSTAIYWLEKTYAHRFYLNRNAMQDVPRFIELEDDVCAWKFLIGNNKWHGTTLLSDMAIYKKGILLSELNMMIFNDVYELEQEMKRIQASPSKIGLFFKHEKVQHFME